MHLLGGMALLLSPVIALLLLTWPLWAIVSNFETSYFNKLNGKGKVKMSPLAVSKGLAVLIGSGHGSHSMLRVMY